MRFNLFWYTISLENTVPYIVLKVRSFFVCRSSCTFSLLQPSMLKQFWGTCSLVWFFHKTVLYKFNSLRAHYLFQLDVIGFFIQNLLIYVIERLVWCFESVFAAQDVIDNAAERPNINLLIEVLFVQEELGSHVMPRILHLRGLLGHRWQNRLQAKVCHFDLQRW